MEFRHAQENELEAVLDLYDSVRGLPFCTWDERYPGMDTIQDDFKNNCLFVACEGQQIIGAASIVPQNELNELPFWEETSACEIARIAAAPDQQGKGIGTRMIKELTEVIRQRGAASIHLLAAIANPAALRLYPKCGFSAKGECEMFGIAFRAFEMLL